MGKAIEVKHLGPTNTKPARLIAFAEGGNRHIQSRSPDDLTALQEAAGAAYVLADRMRWQGVWVGGYLANGNAVFVNIGRAAGELSALSDYLSTLPLGSWFEIYRPEGGEAS
jgi:hypothetical protein